MKTILATLFAVVLLVSSVLPGVIATTQTPFDGTTVCREQGQRYDVATWVWSGTAWVKQYERPGFHTQVTGDNTEATWTSNKQVRSALAVTETGATEIGTKVRSGTVTSEGLQSIVLCTRGASGSSSPISTDGSVISDERRTAGGGGSSDTEVPEFGGVLAIATIGLLGVGLVARKRSE